MCSLYHTIKRYTLNNSFIVSDLNCITFYPDMLYPAHHYSDSDKVVTENKQMKKGKNEGVNEQIDKEPD